MSRIEVVVAANLLSGEPCTAGGPRREIAEPVTTESPAREEVAQFSCHCHVEARGGMTHGMHGPEAIDADPGIALRCFEPGMTECKSSSKTAALENQEK
jgi:hypothetical protein